MSKSAATLESRSDPTPRGQRARKSRAVVAELDGPDSLVALDANAASPFPMQPLLVGVGIGATLALTAVALGSRSKNRSYLRGTPSSVVGAFAKTAMVLLARAAARKLLAAAANQGARKLASAWPF